MVEYLYLYKIFLCTSMTMSPKRKPKTLHSSPRQERLEARTRESESLVAHKKPFTKIFLYADAISPME